MARTKSTPVRREVSEEYFSREMRSRKGNGVATSPEKRDADKVPAAAKKEAGLTEVAIAVGGIYASL